jgi:hypothetical protein
MLRNKSKSHSLANKLTPMRIRLEKFLLDYSDGRFKNKSNHGIINEAMALIEGTIARIDDILC